MKNKQKKKLKGVKRVISGIPDFQLLCKCWFIRATYMSVSTGLLIHPDKGARRQEMNQWSLSSSISPQSPFTAQSFALCYL